MQKVVPELTVEYSDPEFFQALSNPEGLLPHLEDAMQTIMAEFVARASVPAPESEANKPGRIDQDGRPMGYYERGRGWWYPILTKNMLAKGIPSVGRHSKAPHTMGAMMLRARRNLNAAGYRLSPTSEQMEDNWQAEISLERDEVIGELMNFASYSGFVQGYEQIQLHKERGWQNVQSTWNSDEMQAVVSEATDRAIAEFFNLG